MAQDENDQDNDNDNDDSNTDEYPYGPHGIALDLTAAHGKISGVSPPEHPVDLLGVAPPENEVDNDVVPTLSPSYYGRNDESDNEDEDIDTPTQRRRRVINHDAMLPTVRNLYNLFPLKQTDYLKGNIDQSMSFTQVGNDLNYDVLVLLQQEGM